MAQEAIVSRRTWIVGVAGVGLSALFYVLYLMKVGGDALEPVLANGGNVLVIGLAACFVIWAATRFAPGVPLRLQWLLLGLGALSFAVGNVIWAYYEIVLRAEVPFPGLPDIFYCLTYPLLAGGVWLAALSFRKMFDLRVPMLVGAGVAVLATVGLYFWVFQTILADPETSGLTLFLSLFYPLADVWLLLVPTIALIIVASRLSGGTIAWPWWAVAVSIVLIAVADSYFTAISWSGTYASGNPVDLGWVLGYSVLAVGASLVLDVQKVGV